MRRALMSTCLTGIYRSLTSLFFIGLLGSSAFNTQALLAQEPHAEDFIVTLTNDTIKGKVKSKNFYTAQKITLHKNNTNLKFHVRKIKEIQVGGDAYVRIEMDKNGKTRHLNFLTQPLIREGDIRLFKGNKRMILVKDHTVFNVGYLKYYADDYPETPKFLNKKIRDQDSLVSFILDYNTFQNNNPESQCFAERNSHQKEFFNPQIAINFLGIIPHHGYIGSEFGISRDLTMLTRVSYLLGKENAESENLRLIPFTELGAKYYFLDNQRISKNRSTYRNTGFNASSTYMYPIENHITTAIRLELGFKSVTYNRLYLDYNIGVLRQIENAHSSLWLTWGMGYILK